MKKDVFERLAKEYYRCKQQARRTKQLGYGETASRLIERGYGIIDAVEALGFNADEFIEYYEDNRSRFRQEYQG